MPLLPVIMTPNRKALFCLLPVAGLLLAGGGCAQHDDSPTTATRIIMPGDQELTKPEAPEVSSEPAAPPPAATGSQPAPQVAATTPAASAPAAESTTTPSAEPTTATAPAETTGTEFAAFRGRVTVNGTAPALPSLRVAGDPAVKDRVCVEKAIPDESVVVGEGGGLADVFVYAKRLPPGVKAPPPPTEPAVLDQLGCRFIPQAMVFQVGQPLQMKNSDPVSHNVRTSGLTTPINQILSPNNQEGIEVQYKRPERVPVGTKCDIHAWMLSWHLPVDHPYAAVTGADGSFEIADLPAGAWEFVIWHGRSGYVEKSYKFQAASGQVVRQDFSVPAAKLSQ